MPKRSVPEVCAHCGRPIKRVGLDWRHLPSDPGATYLPKWCTISPGVPLSSNPKAEPAREASDAQRP